MVLALPRESDVLLSDDELTAVRNEVNSIPGVVRSFRAVTADGATIELPAVITTLVRDALNALAEHGTVTLGTIPRELTSNTAAEILGVSRPTLLKMARNDEVPSFKVGTHTRFKREDILALKHQREQERGRILDEMLDIEAQLGLDN